MCVRVFISLRFRNRGRFVGLFIAVTVIEQGLLLVFVQFRCHMRGDGGGRRHYRRLERSSRPTVRCVVSQVSSCVDGRNSPSTLQPGNKGQTETRHPSLAGAAGVRRPSALRSRSALCRSPVNLTLHTGSAFTDRKCRVWSFLERPECWFLADYAFWQTRRPILLIHFLHPPPHPKTIHVRLVF